VAGLGVFAGTIEKLPEGVKRPQMQWNRLTLDEPSHPLVAGVGQSPWVYFVHSYAASAAQSVVASCDYGGRVVAAVGRANVWATQFHPEKSGPVGLGMLANFVRSAQQRVTASR
jgi:glutamine amidotransferase